MISVCMATYNGEKYIEEQLLSIISEISENDEIIISDDGSTDNTLEIVKRLSDKYPFIHTIEGPKKGVVLNFENAIKHSKGDIIFLSDQDDIWVSGKVKRVMEVINNKQCYVVVHDASVVDTEGNQIYDSFYKFRNSRKGFIKNLVKNSYVGCCMAFKSEIKEKIMPFPDYVEMHDWWIGLVAELKYNSVFIDDKLIKYRRHGENVSSLDHYPLMRMIKNRLNLIKALIFHLK